MNYRHNKSIKLLPYWRGYSLPRRNKFFTPSMAFVIGVFVGLMIPLWIKILTK